MKQVVTIIQARLGSTRLPGKVLQPILGQPLLTRMLERVKRSSLTGKIVVATTNHRADAAIVRLAQKAQVNSFRGSEPDVLDRYYQAAKKSNADIIVRLTGDCPLIDPEIINYLVSAFKPNQTDYVSNTRRRSFPRGMDVEVFSFKALETAWKKATTTYDHEHVTPFLYNPQNKFRLQDIVAKKPWHRPDLRLTVDEPDDFTLVKKIYHLLYPQNPQFSLEDIIRLLDQHPELAKINQHVESKPAKYQRFL